MNKSSNNNGYHNLAQQSADLLQHCWDEVSQGHSLDRILAAYFKKNRKLGSKSRRYLTETTFGCFRWWGWLKDLDSAKQQALSRWLDGAAPHPLDGQNPYASQCPSHQNMSTQDKLNFLKNKQWLPANIKLENLWPDSWSDQEFGIVLNQNLIDVFQKRPPLWLRCLQQNIPSLVKELKGHGLEASPHEHMAQALAVQGRFNIYELPLFQKGSIEIQDLASQAVSLICNPHAGERWWDACCGAGGKSLHLAWLMQGQGRVNASDVRAPILKELKRRAKRHQLFNIETRSWSGRGIVGKARSYDGVLVDAPCSGSGTWRRNPDGRWRINPTLFSDMATRQNQIMDQVVPAIKVGGQLIYATCSLSSIENQDVIQRFLDHHSDFQLEDFVNPLSGKICHGWANIGFPEDNADAFFVARLRHRP